MKPLVIKLMILIITSKLTSLVLDVQALISFDGSSVLEATNPKGSSNATKDSALHDQQSSSGGSIGQGTGGSSSGASSNNEIQNDASVFMSKDLTDLRLDQLVQATAANLQQHRNHQPSISSTHHNHRSNHQQHTNHQNYPNEPYPSASYTSHNNQLDALLNRDHHQIANIKGTSYDGNGEAGGFINSYGNQAPSSANGYSNGETDLNVDNYFQQNYGTLNAGLIQNLTASLFPIKFLSNVTLSTLSDLLNKTRQSTRQTTVGDYQSNGYLPQSSYNSGSYPYNNYASSQPLMSSSTNNYRDQHYNLLDYIRPSQFGFRDTSASSRYNQPSTSSSYYRHNNNLQSPASHRLVTNHYPYKSHSNSQQYNYNWDSTMSPRGQNTGYKTSSNIYNTYMPYKEAISSLPTMTNGQTLNTQLYDGNNYLDSNYNMIIKGLKGSFAPQEQTSKMTGGQNSYNHLLQQQSQQASNQKGYGAAASSANGASSGYQYIQQHNINNQNHLDKIIYHSTPFRPSIVSPPLPTTVPSTPSSSTSSPLQSLSSSSSLTQHRFKGDNSSDKSSKSSLFGGSNDGKQEYMTNGQAINSNKYAKEASMMRLASTGKGSDPVASFGEGSSTMPSVGSDLAEFDNSGGSQSAGNSTAQPTSPLYDEKGETKNTNGTHSRQQQVHQMQQVQQQQPFQQHSPTSSMLLDLYEREIDNQIQEALYREQHHLTEPMLGVMASGSQNAWYEKTTPIFSPDSGYLDSASSTWTRPSALSSTSSLGLSPVRSPMRPMVNAASSNHPTSSVALDPLSAALQDLPTFSASDLQPVFPGIGPAYSLEPAASGNQESIYSSLSPSSLTSQMLSLGQNQMNLAALTNQPSSSMSLPSTATIATHTTSSSTPASQSSSQQNGGGLLFRLQSSPLSSIFTSPLTHLYANLSRSKKHQSPPKSKPSSPIQMASTNQHGHIIPSPGSPLSYYLLGGFSGTANSHKPKQSDSNFETLLARQQQQQKIRAQQQAAMAVATATANLLAASSGQRWTPLQSAIIQAHAANAYLNAQPTHTFTHQQVPMDHSQTSSLFGGLAGGGISPLIWRNFMPAGYKTRKQSTTSSTIYGSPSTNSSGQTTSNSNGSPFSLPLSNEFGPSQLASSLIQSVQYPTSNLPFHNTYHGSQNGKTGGVSSSNPNSGKQPLSLHSLLDTSTLSQLLNPLSTTSSSGQATSLKKPRLKVKILKIPVAYYDNPATGNLPASNAGLMSLFPSYLTQSLASSSGGNQLAPSASTTSLLAGLPCPLSHPGSNPVPHSLEQHFMLSQPLPMTISAPEQHQHSHQLQSSTSTPEGPVSIQGFSEINQPNDLQVSPTQTSANNHLPANRLLKMLQWSSYLKES